MEDNKIKYKTIDEYISQFAPDIQEICNKIRKVIKESAPEAEEKISWQMPAYILNGNLVFFAVHKKHIGFYPSPSAIELLKERLAEYKMTKGAIQFPLDKPIPYDLISDIVKFRVIEKSNEAETRQGKAKVEKS